LGQTLTFGDVDVSANVPLMHPCPVDPGCPHCNGQSPPDAPDWSFVDAVYCISLNSRGDRTLEAAAEFHRIGLCRHVTFYRPNRHPVKSLIGMWDSHRKVAMDARKRGAQRTLIFEDDVHFVRPVTRESVAAVSHAVDRLPADWTIFHLGHWPLSGYFVHANVMRTSSACAHAYIVSARMAEWLEHHPWGTANVKLRPMLGKGLDSAYAALADTYALFPMMAIQRPSPSDHFTRPRPVKRLRHLVTRSRHREALLSKLMRPSELAVAALSPLFWIAAKWRRR